MILLSLLLQPLGHCKDGTVRQTCHPVYPSWCSSSGRGLPWCTSVACQGKGSLPSAPRLKRAKATKAAVGKHLKGLQRANVWQEGRHCCVQGRMLGIPHSHYLPAGFAAVYKPGLQTTGCADNSPGPQTTSASRDVAGGGLQQAVGGSTVGLAWHCQGGLSTVIPNTRHTVTSATRCYKQSTTVPWWQLLSPMLAW